MNKGILRSILALLVCICLVAALASCGDDCTHRDADDNGKCDECGEDFTDGDELGTDDPTPCTHRDADDNGKCDECGVDFTDGDEPGTDDPTPCTHRDADDNGKCDECGESYTDGKDIADSTPCQHRDADDNSLCDECGESYTDGKDLPDEHTHDYTVKNTDSKYLDKAADCENAATYFYSCSCGAKGTTTFTHGNANGHSYVIQNVDPKYEKTPASEYTPAVYWKSCACGKASTTETFTHGDMLPGYLTYQLSNDSSFYIVSGFVGAEENISIPHIYDALPVFGIMANAFKNNTTLKSISMPNSIQEIGSYAFAGCTSLESVSIPTSVKSISSYTFSGCTSLKTITLHSGIEELGAFAFENCTALKSITLNEGLKTISNNAFDNCSSLEGITIPDSVTTLGNMAFRDAISLKYVVFSKALASIGNATFENCISLENVELYENITMLGSSTFSNCRGLKTLRILGDLKSIGIATFYDCVNLESIYFASKAKGNIGNTNYIFYNAGINGDGITLTVAKDAIIPEGIFEPFKEDNAPKITKITIEEDSTSFTSFRVYNYLPYLIEIEIPETVLEFDYGIFNNSLWWNKLTDGAVYIDHIFYGIKGETPKVLEIASDTLCIARGALKGHTNITELNIPDSVTYIGSEAFSGCSSLTSVTIPDSVTSIGSSAFSGCSSLESLTLPFVGGSKSATSASSSTLFGYIFGTSSYTGGVSTYQYYSSGSYSVYYIPLSLKSVTITGGNILYGAFSYCTGLTSVTIGDSITSISSSAFSYCTGLTSVTIGDSVTSIGERAFYYCDSLTSVTIPDSVTSIGSSAFSGCSSLESITLPFVGGSKSTTSASSSTLFGYIFGTSSYIGGVATKQYYSSSSKTYYIPSSLKSVTVTGGNILYGAFYNCTGLTSVTIGDSVTSISSSAFSGCSSLESITLPFVGGSRKTASDTYQYPFGYIFGTSSYTGGVETYQYYYGSSTSSTTYGTYYIPSSLKSVTITGGNILYGAFRNCSSLTSVTIGDSVTSISSSAFSGCSSLESITLPFVGGSKSTTSASSSTLFGYIFGTSSYTGGVATKQYYSSSSSYATYYIPSSLKSVTITGGNILYGAFYNCTGLTSVTIGDSVTSIGSSAFSGCSSLESITLPFVGGSKSTTSASSSILFGYIFGTSSYTGGVATKQYYSSSSSYATYYIPSSLKSVTITGGNILYGAFYNCTGLTSVTIGDSVTSIGSSAFYNCDNLTSVYIYDIAAWCGISFDGYYSNPLYYANNLYLIGEDGEAELIRDLVIPDGVTSIGSYAFAYCYSLTSVTIGSGVTSIGDDAFYDCYKLVEVINKSELSLYKGSTSNGWVACYALEIHAGESKIKEYGDYLFITSEGVNYLLGYIGDDTALTLPDKYNGENYEIYERAFYNRDDITSATIPDSVTSIGTSAFYSCDSLTSVTIGSGVTSIGSDAFYSCDSLTSVYIYDIVAWCGISFSYSDSNPLYYADNLYLIGEDEEAKLIEDLVIPDGVTSIGNYAFYSCDSLTSVTIGSGVTSIGRYAFSSCSGLTSVTIPNSVTSIGYDAFNDCDSLTSVTIPDSVTSIGNYAFWNCSSLTSVTFADTEGWWYASSPWATSGTAISATSLANASTAAEYLKSTYCGYYWFKD